MKIKLNGIVNPELKGFLLSQDGITDVGINNDDYLVEIIVKFDQKVTPVIVMKYIDLFEKNKYSNLAQFSKDYNGKSNMLKYVIHDMCCEYCYMSFVRDLFDNDKIISVKSDFDFNKYDSNVEFLIEYCNDYSENELIEYIKEKYN